MTQVRFRIAPDCSAVNIRPLRRYVDAGGIWLARAEAYPLVSGAAVIELEPSIAGPIGAWVVAENNGVTRCIAVPDSTIVLDYETLADVDPGTFEPSSPAAIAGWLATLAGVQLATESALADVLTAASEADISASDSANSATLASTQADTATTAASTATTQATNATTAAATLAGDLPPVVLAAVTAADIPGQVAASNAGKVDKGAKDIDIRDAPYNADPTGVTDSAAAINAANTAATASGAHLFGRGTFKLNSTVTITNNCDFNDARFNYYGSAVAVQLGVSGTLTAYKRFNLPKVVAANKTVPGWAEVTGSTGVRLTAMTNCTVSVPLVQNFEIGMWLNGTGISYPCAYNSITFGHLLNNKINLQLLSAPNTDATGGWTALNLFYGGKLSHLATEPPAGARNLFIASGYWTADDNHFYAVSFEDSTCDHVIEIYGSYNRFENCRWETGLPHVQDIWCRGTSAGNTLTGGPGLSDDLITYTVDTGAKKFRTERSLTSYATTPTAATLGAGAIAHDTITARPIYSPDGVTLHTVMVQADNGIISGVAPPEGVVTARVGSIYTRQETGTRINLLTRPVGSTNTATTGWTGVGGTLTAPTGLLRLTLNEFLADGARQILSGFVAIIAGQTYRFAAQVRSDTGNGVFLRAEFRDGASNPAGTSNGTVIVPNATTFTDIPAVTAVPPAAATQVRVYPYMYSGTNAAGKLIELRDVVIELAGAGASTVFTGDTADVPGVVDYAWTGTANASTSTSVYAGTGVSYVKDGTPGNTGWRVLL